MTKIVERNGRKELVPTWLAATPQSRCVVTPTIPHATRFHGKCVAITSLNPNPARLARQLKCLQSWLDIGLPVVVVNTAAEISNLKSQIDGVMWQPSEELTTDYDRQTIRVSALVDIGIAIGLPFMLLNSDIEIQGRHEHITQALFNPGKLTIGVRWNYSGKLQAATSEPWGLDCFLMTPEMAKTLPQMPFGLGKPVWDYWLPLHFRKLGYAFNWIVEPFFYHESHPIAWSQSEWLFGAETLRRHYGFSLFHDSATFRESL